MRQLITSDEASEGKDQITQPCSDCPWARAALRGWLGGHSVDDWLEAVQSDARIDCHALNGIECAGAAIYRDNICKLPRDLDVLRLDGDTERVFDGPAEFRQHHTP